MHPYFRAELTMQWGREKGEEIKVTYPTRLRGRVARGLYLMREKGTYGGRQS